MFTRFVAKHLYFKLIVAGFLLLSPALVGQSTREGSARTEPPSDQKAASEAMTELKAGEVNLVHLHVLGRTGSVEAVPYLEKEFANTTETIKKTALARVLVQLKDTNGVYWDYLVNSVDYILNLNEPDLSAYDSEGKAIPGPSAAFIAWAKAKRLDLVEAEQDALITHPAQVLYLGLTGDQHAVPLLRRALESHNYFIEARAARGLAAIGDSFSVPLIIQAVSHAPADPAGAIAQSLLYFDDPDAQYTFNLYVPKEIAQGLREAKAKGMGPKP